MKLVVALGGHALASPGGASLAQQQAAVARAVAAISALAREHALVVTHGNGPQIGWLANLARAAGETPAFDVLGAESEGMLGYWLEQELRGALPGREVAALLTQVEVDARDVAFQRPSKPIGPVLSAAEADALRATGVVLASSSAPIHARRRGARTKRQAASTFGPIEPGSKARAASCAREMRRIGCARAGQSAYTAGTSVSSSKPSASSDVASSSALRSLSITAAAP